MISQIAITGTVSWRLLSKESRVLAAGCQPNLVVTVGKALLSGLITGLGTTAPTFLALGTGATAAAATDTALQTEIVASGGQRKAATVSQVTTTTTNDTARYIASYAFTASFSVTEAGLLTAISVGTLLARTLFAAPIAVVNGNVLEVTWDVKFA